MKAKTTSLNPLLIMLAVALALAVLGVACGSSATSTTAATAAQVPAATAVPEVAQVAEATAVPEVAMVEGGPKYGGTLTVAMVADHVTLDPPLHTSVVDIAITQNTYDNLLMIQPDSSVKPELATSWEPNDDLSSYTFHLREGVKFHNGKTFKAEDVKFSFERLLDPEIDSPARPTYAGVIDDMVIIDDYTIRFDLQSPNAFFPDSLSIYQARIVPNNVEIARLHLEEFGSGPFRMIENLFGQRTTLARYDDYWEEGKPYLDEIVILNIPEPATRVEALKSGDVDVVYRMEVQSALGLVGNPDVVALELASPGNRGLDMDNTVPPFDNVLVRKAIQAAADRDAIHQAAFLGKGAIAFDHPFPENDPLHNFDARPPEYNIELAKDLLAQAGYEDGIDLTLYTSTVSPGLVEIAVAFKESAAPAGIRVDVVRKPEDGYWDVVWGVEPFTVVSWFGRANVDQALSIQYHSEGSWMVANYDPDKLAASPNSDELIERARGEKFEAQKETYAQLQALLIEEVPRLNLV